jgi:prevent-host-death family protein
MFPFVISLGIYETKTKLSEICEQVAQTGEPVVVTRRGVPLVQIDPVEPVVGTGSKIWGLRDRFVAEHGELQVDIELPPRTVERRESPF